MAEARGRCRSDGLADRFQAGGDRGRVLELFSSSSHRLGLRRFAASHPLAVLAQFSALSRLACRRRWLSPRVGSPPPCLISWGLDRLRASQPPIQLQLRRCFPVPFRPVARLVGLPAALHLSWAVQAERISPPSPNLSVETLVLHPLNLQRSCPDPPTTSSTSGASQLA
jgi:hypothetical protein